MENTVFWGFDQVYYKPAVHRQVLARDFKFRILIFYYLSSNNGADQTVTVVQLICAFVLHI